MSHILCLRCIGYRLLSRPDFICDLIKLIMADINEPLLKHVNCFHLDYGPFVLITE